MSTRTKIAIAIIAAILYFLFTNWTGPKSAEIVPDGTSVADLDAYYAGANDEYFAGKLKKPIITLDDTDMKTSAYTQIRIDGTPLIHINIKAVPGQRYSRLTLTHEMCHVEAAPLTGDFNHDHDRLWQACMLRIEAMGANRFLLIDNYKEGLK